MIIDHGSDTNGVELFRLAKLYPFPAFVKSAGMAETMRPQNLPPTAYALYDNTQRRFPCHTPASTWLSALYFEEKQGAFHPKVAGRIRQHLDQATTFWGIKAAVDAMRQQHAQMTKRSDDGLPDTDFAVVWSDDLGHKHRHCRLKTARDVQAAAVWLNRNQDQLRHNDRHVIATKIMEKAAQLGANLAEHETFIERQAGRGVCDPHEVAQMLQNRAKLAKDGQLRAGVEKLAGTVQRTPRAALTPDMLIKLAGTVDSIDRSLGLTGRYTTALPRPEDVIFKITLKEARASLDQTVTLTTGHVYDRQDFVKLSLESLRDLFGPDLVRRASDGLDLNVEKLAEVAGTLPRPDAEAFEALLDEAGVPPLNKTAAAPAWLDPATAAALAEAY